MFKELSEGSDVASIFAAHYLEEKIHKKFNDKIQILMSNKKKSCCSKGISNIDDSLFAHLKDQDTLQAAAAILREEILGITKTKLPDYLTSQRLIKEEDFQKGFFGIKRTNKPFSRQPIDLTLEQTINADAARTLTGIAHLTNSISARQRWARSHDIRSTILPMC
ncbi:uncharacterized protein TNCV_4484941 [Trichonephila clavipes]|nr:uncharacterized protein TNCV_4484941 [Trichonephila clavipes]